jgi:NAD(P)H-hydrate epimerase
LLSAVIQHINTAKVFVLSIDTPSGLLSEQPMSSKDTAVEADITLTFQYPKISFFLAENARYVGRRKILDIRLDNKFLNKAKIGNYLIDHYSIKSFLNQREKFVHKGNFGHGLLIAGSYGMMGAAVLAARAALRTGIGLLTVNVPKMAYNIMQISAPEALCRCDENDEHFTSFSFDDLTKYNALAIGCGLGTHPDTAQGLKKLIGDYGGSIIFDADAINILAENKTWLEFLPPNCIFTPHLKEFERLTRKASDGYDRLALQREFSIQHNCVVILKGANTSISTQLGAVYFNSSGNPGMAKGGSGDVLTGILLSLMAQGYTAAQAAIIGVYLHGLSADKATKKQSLESLIPSDIIENIGQGFKSIYNDLRAGNNE